MRQRFKNMAALFLCALLCGAVLGGCQSAADKQKAVENSQVAEAEKTLESLVGALKIADMAAAQQYMDISSLETDGIDFADEQYKPLAQAVFSKLECSVLSSEVVDENNVRFHVSVTAVDMKPVMGTWIQNLMKKALEMGTQTQELTEEEQVKMVLDGLVEAAQQTGGQTKETEVDVTVAKVDGTWKVQATNDFANALLGGMMEAADSLQSSLGQ